MTPSSSIPILLSGFFFIKKSDIIIVLIAVMHIWTVIHCPFFLRKSYRWETLTYKQGD